MPQLRQPFVLGLRSTTPGTAHQHRQERPGSVPHTAPPPGTTTATNSRWLSPAPGQGSRGAGVAAGSITGRQSQKDTSFYLQHSSSDRQQEKKKRKGDSIATRLNKGKVMAATTPPHTPPEAHWCRAEPPAVPSLPAQSTGGQGAAPTAPHGLLGVQLARLLCSDGRGWHSRSPSLRGDDAETTRALPGARVPRKPPLGASYTNYGSPHAVTFLPAVEARSLLRLHVWKMVLV